MKVLDLRALRGPNLWSRHLTIYMRLDLEDLAELPTEKHPGFTDRLMKLLPSLIEHRCGVGCRGGFLGRMREGTYLAHVVEHVAIELQCLAGMEVGFGKTRETHEPGIYRIVFRYRDENAGLEAGRLAVELVENTIARKPFDIEAGLQRLREIREESMFGPSTSSIVEEAVRRDIPFLRLNEASLVQLGWGAQQRRIQATMTGATSALGVEIADDKNLAKQLLSEIGVPTPEGRVVNSLEAALEAAKELDFPVTVKPLVGNHGRGISVKVEDAAQIEDAFRTARGIFHNVLVERHLAGRDFRILVVGHRCVAAALRTPAHVVGDGRRTVRELLDDENSDPRRGFGHEKVLTLIALDEMSERLLHDQGLSLEAVPAAGREVRLKSTANLSTGGTAEDVTDLVHPANKFLAERISRCVGLDVMGIDIVAPTLETPLGENGGGVVEVNAAPGFRMHLSPTKGESRNVAVPVVDALFGENGAGRIPLVSVTGTNGKTTTVRLIAHLLQQAGRCVGMTTTDGVVVGGHRVLQGDYSGPGGASVVLRDPTVDVAVLEVARGGILRRGLGYDRADVAVVLNVTEDHLGQDGIMDLDTLAEVKRVVADSLSPEGRIVLNADDPKVLGFQSEAKVPVILFSLHPESEPVRRHLENGGDVMTVEERQIVFRRASNPAIPILSVLEAPITFGGRALFNIQNALAATAAAQAALDIKVEDLRSGLTTFHPSISQSRGRMNLIEVGGVNCLVDFAHNPTAVKALAATIREIAKDQPKGGKRIGVVSGTGNRRAEDTQALGRIFAETFTDLIVKDSDCRGMPPGETAELLASAAFDAGFSKRRLKIVIEERAAVEASLESARSGDLVVVCPADDISGTIGTLLEKKELHAPDLSRLPLPS
ncbi:MAG: cyanophycin synthetase [Elusimicrobiota bacterium]